MSYGFRVYDEDGNIVLDISDRITRLIFSHIAEAGEDGSVDLPDIDGFETCQFAIALEASTVSHLVERDGTTITWTHRGADSPPGASGASLILVFAYT